MPHQELIINGIKYPSATELTSLLPQAWLWSWYKSQVKKHGYRGWQLCKAQSKRGMAIGSEVHTLLESFINKKEPEFNITGKYDSQSIADALFDKVNPLVDEWVAIEPHLKSEELKIQGTADAIIRMNLTPGLVLLDWKTSAQKSETHPIQLACYAFCWNEEHPDQKIEQGIIARVDKKSKKLTVHLDEYKPLSQYYPIVRALRTIWEYENV